MDPLFETIAQTLDQQGFTIQDRDANRPWGGFFVIDESQAQAFADTYFNGLSVETLKISGKLSPKILLVKPNQKLSWQYHHRRAEIWRVVSGTVWVVSSFTDVESNLALYHPGDQITLKQGQRHRMIGTDDWAVVAEIWQHTDPENPSNEDDIVRLQDDYGR
jgi:mannose-6-phosphate isomerase-like protein (cupin superfamily)